MRGRGLSALDPYDREALKLDAYSLLGWHDLEATEIALILGHGVSAASVSLIAAHLIRYPDGASAARLFDILESRPLGATAENCGSHVALLCAAGVNGLDARMKQEADVVGGVVGGAYPAWDHVRAFFESRAPEKNPSDILPALGQLPAGRHVRALRTVPPARSALVTVGVDLALDCPLPALDIRDHVPLVELVQDLVHVALLHVVGEGREALSTSQPLSSSWFSMTVSASGAAAALAW